MRERITRPLALFVVSVLLVALSAGAALALTCTGGWCYGTGGDDDIYGSNYTDYIKAYSGNDYVDAWYSDDTVNPGSGNDSVYGWYGNDYFSGNALGGNYQTDELGNDYLYGESGNDTIYDWYGYDHVYGGYGNDTIDVRGGAFYDYVDCGPDYDKVYRQSNDTVVNCELVYTTNAGAKSEAHMERLEAPKLSKAHSNSATDAKSLGEKEDSAPLHERSPAK